MTFSRRSVKAGGNSFKKLILFELLDILISFIIDFATSDYKDMMSYSIGWPVKVHIFSI
jgi:hypothetical protein